MKNKAFLDAVNSLKRSVFIPRFLISSANAVEEAVHQQVL